MNRLPALLLLSYVASCLCTGDSFGTAPLGLPDLKLLTVQNETIRTTDLRGDIVFLDLWKLACVPCDEMRSSAARLNPQFGARGVRFLAINEDDTPAAWKKFLWLNPSPQIEVQDQGHQVRNALVATELPAVFLIDRLGQVRWRHVGWTSDSEREAAQQLEGLLREPPARPKS